MSGGHGTHRVLATTEQVGLQVGLGLFRNGLESAESLLCVGVTHNHGQRRIVRSALLQAAVAGERSVGGREGAGAGIAERFVLRLHIAAGGNRIIDEALLCSADSARTRIVVVDGLNLQLGVAGGLGVLRG